MSAMIQSMIPEARLSELTNNVARAWVANYYSGYFLQCYCPVCESPGEYHPSDFPECICAAYEMVISEQTAAEVAQRLSALIASHPAPMVPARFAERLDLQQEALMRALERRAGQYADVAHSLLAGRELVREVATGQLFAPEDAYRWLRGGAEIWQVGDVRPTPVQVPLFAEHHCA